MRLCLKNRTKGQIEFGMIYGGIAMLALCAAYLLPIAKLLPNCVFHHLTGFPCPTCGTTRSLVHLAHGEIAAAFAMNPLAAFGVLFAVFAFWYGLLTFVLDSRRITIRSTDHEKNVLRAGAVMLAVTNWFYLIFFV